MINESYSYCCREGSSALVFLNMLGLGWYRRHFIQRHKLNMNLTLIRDLGMGRIKHFDTAKLCRTASA